MTRRRRHFEPEEKAKILRLHFVHGVPVQKICEDFNLNRNVYYRWQKQLFDNAATALQRKERSPLTADENKHASRRSTNEQCARPQVELDLMVGLSRGVFDTRLLLSNGFPLPADHVAVLLAAIRDKPRKYRNRAIAILAHAQAIPHRRIAHFLTVSPTSVKNWIAKYKTHGCQSLLSPSLRGQRKVRDDRYRQAIFEILHSPPASHGINRTTWRLRDIQCAMATRGLPIGHMGVTDIIRKAGYSLRKARTVLTSLDPAYRKKVDRIVSILSNLSSKEMFFSVDEFGPFAVKLRGGRSYVPKGRPRVVPQRQTIKGTLIITGALELSTNQITHFYSPRKDSSEMIKLLNVLIRKYKRAECIYFSWDAASWHASKAVHARVQEINASPPGKSPRVELVPLPSGAQFLNVIESIYSGMARAILENSDYDSVPTCMRAIDRHFAERNAYYKAHPKRAGGKIWGEERVAPEFSESSNCKDPRYSR